MNRAGFAQGRRILRRRHDNRILARRLTFAIRTDALCSDARQSNVGHRLDPDRHRHGAQPHRAAHRPRATKSRPDRETRKPMAKRIETKDLDIYYGKFLAVSDVTLTVAPRSSHRLHRPVRLRQVHRAAHAQPHARGHRRGPRRGQGAARRRRHLRHGVDPVDVRRTIGMVFQRPNPFPTMSIYDNVVAGLKLNSKRLKQVRDRLDRREVAARREPLGRGQGPPRQARRRAVRWPAAAPVHRPRDRRRAAGAADGRAVLGAGPDLHARDRGPHPGAQGEVHDRHRHPQHAAGGAGVRARPRSSTWPPSASPASSSRWTTPRRSSPTRPTAAPRTTSPAASAEPPSPRPAVARDARSLCSSGACLPALRRPGHRFGVRRQRHALCG